LLVVVQVKVAMRKRVTARRYAAETHTSACYPYESRHQSRIGAETL
jgi:hypothetical protein